MKYVLPAALLLTFGISFGATSIGARAATFEAEVKGNEVKVFSTSTKKEGCMLKNSFSYLFKGERFTTTQTCNVNVLPGKHREVCHVKHTDIVEGKIEKSIEIVSCVDQP